MGKVCKNICYVHNIKLIFGNSMNQVRVFVYRALLRHKSSNFKKIYPL